MAMDKKWWYVIGAVAGIGVYFLYKWYTNNQANNAANTTAANQPSGAMNNSTGGTTTGSTTPLSTLSDWMNAAQSWAVSSLGSDPALAENALQAYSNGNCLSQQEFNIIDKALGALGEPPNAPYTGVILCPNATTSTSTTTTDSTPTPTPAAPVTASAAPANLNMDLQQELNTLVGTLSTLTGKVSTPAQIASWVQQAGGQNTIAQQLFIQGNNIGTIWKQLPNRSGTQAQVLASAQQIASQRGYTWANLDPVTQGQFQQIANVNMMIKNNTVPAKAA